MNRRFLLKSIIAGLITLPFANKVFAKNSAPEPENNGFESFDKKGRSVLSFEKDQYALVVRYDKNSFINQTDYRKFKYIKKGDVFIIVDGKNTNSGKFWLATDNAYPWNYGNLNIMYGVECTKYPSIEKALQARIRG